MGKKAKLDLTPEQRAVMEEWWREWRERLINLPRQTEDEREGLRQIGEYLGVTPQQVLEIGKRLGIPRLPDAETAPPEPTAPQQKPRKQGGGNKPKLEKEEIEHGKTTFRAMLDENSAWAQNQEAAAKHLLEKLGFGERVSWQTVKRRIVAPVLEERAQNKPPSKTE
jgi:hypothetical protein